LLAYLLVARKTAAWAISSASPKRFRGMAFNASWRAWEVMAMNGICIIRSDHPLSLLLFISSVFIKKEMGYEKEIED